MGGKLLFAIGELSKVHMMKRLRKIRKPDRNSGKNIPGHRNSMCKGPEARICLACWRNRKEVSGAQAK